MKICKHEQEEEEAEEREKRISFSGFENDKSQGGLVP